MIASFIDGRVPIRDAALKNPDSMALVLGMIKAQAGVIEATPNPRTGSVLVLYDPEVIPRETLLEAAQLLEKQLPLTAPARAGTGKSLLDCLKRPGGGKGRISSLSSLSESGLMAGLFLLTALTGFTSRRAHITLALAFAAAAGIHLYDRRRCL